MIAKSRHMAAHDFLLVLLSAAVLSLMLWPPAPAVREIEIRLNDGSTQAYQLAAGDPKLANLAQKLQHWSTPKPSAKLAISKWQAELGSLYANRTAPRVTQQPKRILPVSYYPDDAEKRATAVREAAELKQQHIYWLEFQRQAERVTQAEKQRQEQMLELRSNPAITIGDLQPGPYPPQALLYSSIIGLCASMLFGAWNYMVPSIQLVKQASGSAKAHPASSKPTEKPLMSTATQPAQFQVMLPAKWLKVHQPLGVWIRQAAYLMLIVSVVLVASSSAVSPQSGWRGFPARVLWGENFSNSPSPIKSNSTKPMLRMPKGATSMLLPLDQHI